MNTSAEGVKETLSSFYETLLTAGFVPLLAILIGIRALIGGVGVVFNLFLVWVTIRNKNLHGPCNILIALESFSLAIYGLGFFPMWAIVLSGQNLVPLQFCFLLMILPVFAKNFSSVMMLAIGLDRFKSVLFPWISPRLEKFFIIFWTTICTVFGLYVAIVSHTVMLRIPNNSVMCTASEVVQQEAAGFANVVNLVLNYSSPAVYCIFGIFMHLNKTVPTQSNRRLFKSIFVLMLIQLLGWSTNALSLFFFAQFFAINGMSDMAKWAINCVFSYLLILAVTANTPALYFCSSEYKKAILTELRFLCNKKSTDVGNNEVQIIRRASKLFGIRSTQ